MYVNAVRVWLLFSLLLPISWFYTQRITFQPCVLTIRAGTRCVLFSVQNYHVDQLDNVINEEFKSINVSQVISSRDSIFMEMYHELNASLY